MHKQMYWRTNLRILNATFECFILHYIMEYIGNLCSPHLLHEGEFIFLGPAQIQLHVCA